MSQSTDPEDSHHVLDPAVDPFTYHQLPGEDSQANRQSRYALLDHGPNVPALVPDGDGALDSEDVTGPSSSTSVSDPHEPSLVPPEPIRFNALSPSLVNSSARDSFATGLRASPEPAKTFLSSENPSRTLLGEKNGSQQGVDGVDEARAVSTRRRRRKWWIISAVAIAFVVIALAVILPVVLVAVKNNSHTSSGLSGGGGGDGGDGGGGGGDGGGGGGGGKSGPPSNPNSPTGATTGGSGSQVITADGGTFTYINNFGGYWIDDPKDPFNNGARAQSFTPALNETWDYTQNQIRGVNLGGWLVLEPFISPALYEKYQGLQTTPWLPGGIVNDEWTLSVAMTHDASTGGGIEQIEEHYKTFITEQDFAEIAGAGLNWIRLPIPYWAIETWGGEPFLAKVAWKYTLLAFQWARKYGIRVFLELHSAPGSQNGFNHSGRLGPINFLNGPMGIANADRVMGYIRIIAEFISQKEYQDVVQMFGVLNEPMLGVIGKDQLTRFYLQAHDMIRDITGIGKGAYIVIHDGFQGLGPWKDFLPGSDRIILDTHPYVAFGGGMNQPIDHWPPYACNTFQVNQSLTDFGVTITGEFSGAINDCGLWVRGVGNAPTYANCAQWDDWQNWTPDMKNGIKSFIMASMDAMHYPGYFFWTWKIGNSSQTGTVQAPFWSYQLGLRNGWIPADPRDAVGTCGTLGVTFNDPFITQFQPWQTGGAGAGKIAAAAVAAFGQYPPPEINNVAGIAPADLPRYTNTAAIPTLSTASFPAATATAGDGWADPQDTMLIAAPIEGCVYPDAWFPPPATVFACAAAGV